MPRGPAARLASPRRSIAMEHSKIPPTINLERPDPSVIWTTYPTSAARPDRTRSVQLRGFWLEELRVGIEEDRITRKRNGRVGVLTRRAERSSAGLWRKHPAKPGGPITLQWVGSFYWHWRALLALPDGGVRAYVVRADPKAFPSWRLVSNLFRVIFSYIRWLKKKRY